MESGSKILNKYSFSTKASISKINKILTILSEKALCRHEIAAEIHVNFRHTKSYIDFLLLDNKIYISSWCLENKGDRTMYWPYYRAGNKKSKAKPLNLTSSEKCKRYRKKLLADDDRLDKLKSKRRLKRIIAKPDWTTSWIKASNTTQINDAGV